MRVFSGILVFIVGLRCFSDPVSVEVNLRPVITLFSMKKENVRQYERGGVVSWVFDSSGNLIAFQNESMKTIRMFSPNFGNEIEVENEKEIFSTPYVGINCLVEDGSERFTLKQRKGRIVNEKYEKNEYEKYITSIEDVIIFINTETFKYSSYLIKSENDVVNLNHEATLKYIKANFKGIIENNQVLYYKNNQLKFPINQIDDDGNFYESSIVVINGIDSFEILSKNSINTRKPSLFDNEGNYWQLDFTKDEAQHPILLYAGRDWGYKEPPKKAITTDSGLRIRLRATIDAFVLGTLDKNQAITILKTGEKATIGGITAPWYRIKTKDGLIGWAFGGYIKITE